MTVHHDITTVSHQEKKALGLVIIILITTGVGMITIMTTTTEVITIVAVKQPLPNLQLLLLSLAIRIKGLSKWLSKQLKLSLQIQRKKKNNEVLEVARGVVQPISSNKHLGKQIHRKYQLQKSR